MKLLLLAFLIMTGFWCSTCHPQPKAHLSSPGKDSLYVIGRATSDGIGKFFQGREIARVMGASGADWLERGDRQQEENTDLAIEKMNLTEDAAVADIGAGTGYYSFRLASKVPKGTVYAVDIQPEMIDYLNKKKASLKVSNVRVVESSPESPNLPDSSIDLAIMVDVYHELEYPFETIRSIKKCLKPAGKILLIEYRGEDPSIPIKALHKTTVEQLIREMKLNGFKLTYRGDFLPIQHFLVFQGLIMKKLKNIHPGDVLQQEFLAPMNITAYRLSKETHLPQTRISEILKGNRRITADTALRLSIYFGTSAKFWLGLQNDYDIEEEQRSSQKELKTIRRFDAPAA